jgi:sodium/hydrogen antiporter
VVPIYRLVGLGILVLILRRLPFLLALHKMIPQIENIQQAVFIGFFGPVGVSAVFYLLVAVKFVETLNVDGEPREDVKHLAEVITVVVWFLVICSVVCADAPALLNNN